MRIFWMQSPFFVFSIYVLASCHGQRICSTHYHCYDKNTNITYKDGDVWNSINYQKNSCAECICMETKEYTVSCFDLEFINKSDAKSRMKRHYKISDSEKKYGVPPSSRNTIVHYDIEHIEEDAFKIKCRKGTINATMQRSGKINSKSERIIIKQNHHFFTKRIMHCCKKVSFYRDVDPSCTVVFDELCNSQVVNRRFPELPCNKPFKLTVS
uniref:uncharacterized protein LOC120344776 n=1 Tax=Styela clava TaxID=7725 RepID=UPI00193A3D5C|nr:uncharacterized protein LOC120344776 [Styela clava]